MEKTENKISIEELERLTLSSTIKQVNRQIKKLEQLEEKYNTKNYHCESELDFQLEGVIGTDLMYLKEYRDLLIEKL